MTAVLGLLFAAAIAGKPHSVAIVDRVEGKAALQRVGAAKSRPLRKSRLTSLRTGDQLEVSDGKLVVGFIASGVWQELGPGSYEVEKNGCRVKNSSGKVRDLPSPAKVTGPVLKDGWDALQAGSGQGAALVARGRDLSDGPPPQVIPIRGEMLLNDRPDFAWPAAEKAKRYTLRLTAGGSGRLIWQLDSDENELRYPDDQPPLTRNRKYIWTVTPVLPDDDRAPLLFSSEFTVDREWSQAELDELSAAANSCEAWRVLLAIASYQAYGLEQAALAASRRLVEMAPEDPDAWRLLAANLSRAGSQGEADDARRKADELRDDEEIASNDLVEQ